VKGPELAYLVGVRAVSVLSGYLEDRRQALEPRVGEEDAELLAEHAIANVGVPVAIGSELRRSVVRVQRAQAVEADSLVDLV
jgi:hypothetical protein